MEKQIEEKYSGQWRAIWMFAAIPIILGLTMPLGSWIAGNGFVDALLPAAEVEAAVFFMLGFGWWLSKDQKPTWFLTDDGLLRVKAGKRTAITWQQILNMRLTGFGLMIRWNDLYSDKKKGAVYEERRSLLGIKEYEAKELISIWQRNHTSTSKQSSAIRRVPNRSETKNAGKSIFAGCLGLILFIAEIFSKHWLMALWVGLASATALTLGFGVFKGKLGSITKNILIILLGVWIVCILVFIHNGK
jgi:hypothetical protein